MRIALSLLFAASLAAQSVPEYRAGHVLDPITVDGRLDEFTWKALPRLGAFHNIRGGEVPLTQSAIAWDNRNIYFMFVCADGDPWSNEEEFIWGFHPKVAEHAPLGTLAFDPAAGVLTFEFPLACYLYHSGVPAGGLLRDGSMLRVLRSTDLVSWADVTSSVTLVEGETNGGQIRLSFDYSISSTPCFFTVTVGP